MDTRLKKLSLGEYDAVVVAGAGVKRLNRESEITEWFDPQVLLPAPAQGVLCVVLRQEDREMAEALKPLNDAESQTASTAERCFLRALQGGCRVPVGALGRVRQDKLLLDGLIADPISGRIVKGQKAGPADHPSVLGEELAKDLFGPRWAGYS